MSANNILSMLKHPPSSVGRSGLPWNFDETKKLLDAQKRYPNQWEKIAECLPGRSITAIKDKIKKSKSRPLSDITNVKKQKLQGSFKTLGSSSSDDGGAMSLTPWLGTGRLSALSSSSSGSVLSSSSSRSSRDGSSTEGSVTPQPVPSEDEDDLKPSAISAEVKGEIKVLVDGLRQGILSVSVLGLTKMPNLTKWEEWLKKHIPFPLPTPKTQRKGCVTSKEDVKKFTNLLFGAYERFKKDPEAIGITQFQLSNDAVRKLIESFMPYTSKPALEWIDDGADISVLTPEKASDFGWEARAIKTGGIYTKFAFDSDKKCKGIYVGEAINIKKRMYAKHPSSIHAIGNVNQVVVMTGPEIQKRHTEIFECFWSLAVIDANKQYESFLHNEKRTGASFSRSSVHDLKDNDGKSKFARKAGKLSVESGNQNKFTKKNCQDGGKRKAEAIRRMHMENSEYTFDLTFKCCNSIREGVPETMCFDKNGKWRVMKCPSGCGSKRGPLQITASNKTLIDRSRLES